LLTYNGAGIKRGGRRGEKEGEGGEKGEGEGVNHSQPTQIPTKIGSTKEKKGRERKGVIAFFFHTGQQDWRGRERGGGKKVMNTQ